MSTPHKRTSEPTLTVLMSFVPPRPESNPYQSQLIESLPADVEVRCFSWRNALVSHFDVFHLHWPEVRLRGSTRPRSTLRWLAFLLLLLRIRRQRKALVRTVHNESPHEPLSRLQAALVALGDRWTTAWIVLSDATEPPAGPHTEKIPLGHYRSHLSTVAPSASVPGRLLFFGQVRWYKGVTDLLDVFAGLDDPDVTLHVVGETVDDDLAVEIATKASRDPRVTVVGGHVPDDRLVREIQESELVVLPFRALTNSSSVLLALSLDRPVLAPALAAIGELAGEVGPDWLITYAGPLTTDDLAATLASVRRTPRTEGPDLSGRDWPLIGSAHAGVYRRALAARARRRGRH